LLTLSAFGWTETGESGETDMVAEAVELVGVVEVPSTCQASA
jgi:hypothetical protein